MNFEIVIEPEVSALPDAIRNGIRDSDPAEVGPRDWRAVVLALRGAQGERGGGLYGSTMWSWLTIDGLWVAPELRGQGHGRRLLLGAEALALERGCLGARLGTFDFQARDFYERQGYSVFATLPDFPPGRNHFQLRKYFSPRA